MFMLDGVWYQGRLGRIWVNILADNWRAVAFIH